MSLVIFWCLTIAGAWIGGYWQGKGHGLTEGRAIEMLKRAGFERPMRRKG